MAFENGVFVTIYDDALPDKHATKEKGIPVFQDVVMIKKQVPNMVDCVPRPLQDKDKTECPKSWEAYQTGKEPAEVGYPLKEWAQLTASELRTLQANHIKTIEQLAAVADSSLQRLGAGGMNLKQRAIKFLEKNDRVKELQDEVDALQSKVQQLEKTQSTPAPKPRKKRKKRKKVAKTTDNAKEAEAA